jgi:Ca2+-binding RTX toxin-like protein
MPTIASMQPTSRNPFNQGKTMIDYIPGNDSDNTLRGTNGRDRLYGFSGNDTLISYDSDDALFGGDGSDTLLGVSGTDWLQGATGASAANDSDIIDGGQDQSLDYFVISNQTSSYYLGSGDATLRNFNPSNDYIVVADNASFSQISLSLGQMSGSSAADTIIRMNGELVGVVEDMNITGYSIGYNFVRSNQVNQSTWT